MILLSRYIRSNFFPLLLVAFVAAVAPAAAPTTAPASTSISIEPLGTETCDHLGACQGAAEHDGFVYLYGDANPGIIRQFSLQDGSPPKLVPTGLDISLTRHGQNIINHPTGLTWNPRFGAYLGNTITKLKKATIFHLNWTQMIIDRNLDNSVLNEIDDDASVQGCRPEFVRHGNDWLLASADYGQVNNEVRLYDPAKLATAHKTSEPGVVVARYPCTPFVQQLFWFDSRGLLLLVQNQTEGRRWRLTLVDPWTMSDFRPAVPLDSLPFPNELEGFTMLDQDRCVLVTSSRNDNATFARIHFEPTK